jgi:serine/threonine protein kinase
MGDNVPLETGKKLGPYEILAPIGAGGMGEVYQAKDTRLDRTVAIKVLPGHLSGHSGVRQRFEREAKAVSSLNHPNICTLHDVGNEGGIDYLVMEYLEGEADARTDIFAFGAVVYEMATGHKAFAGKTPASLIASILKEEPRPIADLVPLTPPALDRLIQRCLSKDPDDRWQTARDLKLELDWIREAGSQAGVPAPITARRKTRSRAAWTLTAVFAIATAALGILQLTNQPEPVEVLRFSILPPDKQQLNDSQVQMKVSPDGKSIVFAARDSSGT